MLSNNFDIKQMLTNTDGSSQEYCFTETFTYITIKSTICIIIRFQSNRQIF